MFKSKRKNLKQYESIKANLNEGSKENFNKVIEGWGEFTEGDKGVIEKTEEVLKVKGAIIKNKGSFLFFVFTLSVKLLILLIVILDFLKKVGLGEYYIYHVLASISFYVDFLYFRGEDTLEETDITFKKDGGKLKVYFNENLEEVEISVERYEFQEVRNKGFRIGAIKNTVKRKNKIKETKYEQIDFISPSIKEIRDYFE